MGEQPGTRQLLDHLLVTFYPGTFDLGIFNPASRNDDGSPSLHAQGAALDLGVTVGSRDLHGPGESAFWWLYAHRVELDLIELRWAPSELERGRIWTLRRASEGVRDDSVLGTDAHRSHVHCGQGPKGAAGLSVWYQEPEEDVMTPEQWKKIEEWGHKIDVVYNTLYGVRAFVSGDERVHDHSSAIQRTNDLVVKIATKSGIQT